MDVDKFYHKNVSPLLNYLDCDSSPNSHTHLFLVFVQPRIALLCDSKGCPVVRSVSARQLTQEGHAGGQPHQWPGPQLAATGHHELVYDKAVALLEGDVRVVWC